MGTRTSRQQVGERLEDVVETAYERGAAAWDALSGERVGPPVAVRRWPWALAAALLGAAAGGAVAYVVRRLDPPDAPGAQEPSEVQAVVDRGAPPAP